ncbi:MAG: hypothetical protein ORN21_04805, partial [Methylophilaceae bacterium]|nr:hypothetical protein [Methylophilaceae bacterium]
HDLSLTTKAVLQEVQRGDFSRLPRIYDAVADARLSTVANWQEKLVIRIPDLAKDIAWVIDLGDSIYGIKEGNIDADLLLQTLNESVFIDDPHAIVRALNDAVEAVARTSRAELQREFTAGATAAEALARHVEVSPSEAFADFLAVQIVEQALLSVGNNVDGVMPLISEIVGETLNDLSFRRYQLIDAEALRVFAREQQIVVEGGNLNKAIAIDVDNLSQAIVRRLNRLALDQTGNVRNNRVNSARGLSEALTAAHVLDNPRGLTRGLQGALEVADGVAAPLFWRDGPARPVDAVVVEAAPRVPAALPADAPEALRGPVVEAAVAADARGRAREAGVGRGEFQLSRMQIAVSGV